MLTNDFHYLNKSQLDEATLLLAKAFSNDPLYHSMFESDFGKFGFPVWYFSCLLKYCLRAEGIKILCMGKPIRGICIYTVLNSEKVSLWDIILAGYYQLPLRTSFKNIKELIKINKLITNYKRHIRKSCADGIYINILAVHPCYQRQGLGAHLFQYVKNQHPLTYLMTDTMDNVKFYQGLECYSLKEQTLSSNLTIYYLSCPPIGTNYFYL